MGADRHRLGVAGHGPPPHSALRPADRTATRPVTVADRARDAALARAGAGHGGRRRPRRPGIARAAWPRRADSPGAARRDRRPSLWRAALAARAGSALDR